jgi:hypothetical protein
LRLLQFRCGAPARAIGTASPTRDVTPAGGVPADVRGSGWLRALESVARRSASEIALIRITR